MIKTRIIASVVGGIIIFIWQASSWMFLGIHQSDARYHPQQDAILKGLSSTLTEEGTYMLPSLPPDASEEEHEKMMTEVDGTPIAIVTYVKSYKSEMAMPMIRGFLVDVFLVYLLIYIFTRGGTPPFLRIVAASFSTALFTWLLGPYMNRIWFQVPWSTITPQLIDAVVSWTLCGLWLGWYYNRKTKVNAAVAA